MSAQGVSEMINSVSRIKWWKYRYVLLAVLLLNILLVNHFVDHSFIKINPFRTASERKDQTEGGQAQGPGQKGASNDPKAPSPPYALTPIPLTPATFHLNDYDFDGEYVGWPLQRLCSETVWVPGLTFVCDNNSGGIGNIRNYILTCIRYGIDAGASQLIMPRIQRRSEKELAELFTASFQPFGYFFDEKHFRTAMNTYCPQMAIFNTVEEIPHANQTAQITEFKPKELNVDMDGCDERGVNRHLDMFRPYFDRFLNEKHRTPTLEMPVSLRFRWATFFEWPILRDGPEFANSFGDLLRIRPDIQEIAAMILQEMAHFAGSKAKAPRLDAKYLGVHLRAEADALSFWPSYDEQSSGYLDQAKKYNLKHAYLACGDLEQAKRFKETAKQSNLAVATKNDLLHEESLKRLADLSWDQQALIDFLVLTKSTHFTGCSFSSFSMNIALKRHLMTAGVSSRPWRSPADAFSTLVGRFASWYGDWMFMYECMWP